MKKTLLTFIAIMGIASSAFAQDDNIIDLDAANLVSNETDTVIDHLSDDYVKVDTIDYLSDQIQNLFIGASVGMSLSMGENTRFGNFLDMSRPSFQIEIGKFFYPQFGIRFAGQYLNQKGRAEWEISDYEDKYGQNDGNYDFSMASGFIDGLINFHNVFWRYKENRRFNFIGFFGLGAFYTFGFDKDKLAYLRNPTYKDCIVDGVEHHAGDFMDVNTYGYDVSSKHKWYFAAHAGVILNYMITDAWDVNIDLSFNGTDDGYNGVRFRRVYDTYINALAGLAYHIQTRAGKRRLRYSHYTDQDIVSALNRQLYETNDSLQKALTPVVRMEENVAYNEMLQTTVSFYIDKTFVTEAQKRNVRSVARFMETHPDLDVVVTGYADVQTAYPKYNMMLSQKRAQAVYDLLTNEYGVDPNRLSMDYKGDEEQPFAIVNEWNRAVVFVLKQHDENFKPEVQDKAKNIKPNSHEADRLRQTGSQETRSDY